MIFLEIEGLPVSWKSHGRKSFNPRFKEKEYYQWQIRSQFNQMHPCTGPITLRVVYHMPIPAATSKIRRRQMLSGYIRHIKSPGLIDLDSFLQDSLLGIVLSEKCQVDRLISDKLYSEYSKTLVSIESNK